MRCVTRTRIPHRGWRVRRSGPNVVIPPSSTAAEHSRSRGTRCGSDRCLPRSPTLVGAPGVADSPRAVARTSRAPCEVRGALLRIRTGEGGRAARLHARHARARTSRTPPDAAGPHAVPSAASGPRCATGSSPRSVARRTLLWRGRRGTPYVVWPFSRRSVVGSRHRVECREVTRPQPHLLAWWSGLAERPRGRMLRGSDQR